MAMVMQYIRTAIKEGNMKRYLCPIHAHHLKEKPVSLSSDKCSICRWENRRWTLKDIAVKLQNISCSLLEAHNDPYFDPHGITYLDDFKEVIIGFINLMAPHYKKVFLEEIQNECAINDTAKRDVGSEV